MKVYQFGLLPPTHNEALVRQQLRAAHEYRNDLVAIERGRRTALRAIDDTDEVREMVEKVRAAPKSTRKAALRDLSAARKQARTDAADELARISGLDASIRRDARAVTSCHWGSYLGIEAAHQQSRAQPLYGDDGLTPNDPAFVRGPRWRAAFAPDDPRQHWWLAAGQLGVQLQGGLGVEDALSGTDRRVKLELGPPGKRGRRYGQLSLRVGSDGREPIWATWPIKIHRDIPAGATLKWVRVSVRPEGLRERWTVEITVDLPVSTATDRRPALGAVAIEWEWSRVGDAIRVARWCDDRGGAGAVELPAAIAIGITKPNGIRAVRDLVLNDARHRLVRAIRESAVPDFAQRAAATMHLWHSPQRFRALAMQWQRWLGDEAPPVRMVQRMAKLEPRCESAEHPAYAILAEWERRDAHLYNYEAGARGEALRERRELYRCLAAKWRKMYAVVLLSDQDLSREARWGKDSDVRFVAGVSELRTALRHAFGEEDTIDARWRDGAGEDNERPWCERTRDAWLAGGARGDGRFAKRKEKTVNAWAARKAKSAAKQAETEAARNSGGTAA